MKKDRKEEATEVKPEFPRVKTGIKGGAVADIRPSDDGGGGLTQQPPPPTSSGG
jgi:hypothetical protein